MQLQAFVERRDLSKERVMIGLSGGINSMAVLCWIAQYPEELRPKELFMYYSHLDEHSPDTWDFVRDGVEYAKRHFERVVFEYSEHSILQFFEQEKMIPHPRFAPCTRVLKLVPMMEFSVKYRITVDLVGYIRTEKRRIIGMANKSGGELQSGNTVKIGDLQKHFPISGMDNEWCFSLVKQQIGWYPKIYDIKDRHGRRLFKHNNCLPCKNMTEKDFKKVKKHFPEYYQRAMELAKRLDAHWGRGKGEDCVYCAD